MSTKHFLTVLFIFVFTRLTVSQKTCKKEMLEGDTCIIKLPDEISKKIDANKGEIKWSFTSSSSSFVVQRKNGQNKKTFPDATIKSDCSLNVKVSNSGKYTFEAYNHEDTRIGFYEMEMTVYAKALEPNVTHTCKNGNATLTCDTQKNDKRDLTISWLKGTEEIKDENRPNLFLTSQQLQENTQYSCRVQNPVSNAQSKMISVSCEAENTRKTLFGFDFWIMVGILSGGGALLLLLICVLVICACWSCKQQEKQQDEEELRLRNFDSSPSTKHRSNVTARGQPAPPVPQENSLPATETPPQTQYHTKGPVRARPPPPPQDEDEEEPPPLPRPRKKREKRSQEPYRPME